MLKLYRAKQAIMSDTPAEQYHDDHQAMIDSCWENNTQLSVVQEEYPFGSFKFRDIDCYITHGKDRSVNNKTGEDYKELVFRDIDYDVPLGNYYIFDNNYWLLTNKDALHRVSMDFIVRRCNNVLKWKDGDRVIEYPIVMEYDASKGTPFSDNDIITPTNNVSIIVQANDDTLKLRVNQRFIFAGRPFKLQSMNNYMLNSICGKQEILYFSLGLDEISPYDDFVNNIAYNGDVEVEYDVGEIEIPVHNGLCVEPWFDEVRQNYEKEFEANLWIDGIKQDDDVTVTVTGAPIWAWELQDIGHNKWSLLCKRVAQMPLELTFECGSETKSMIVALTAMF